MNGLLSFDELRLQPLVMRLQSNDSAVRS